MEFQYIHREQADRVLTITMDNPGTMNGLDSDLGPELVDALERAALDSSIRAVVLTGAGGVFSAGGNLKAAHDHLTANPGQGAREIFQGYSGWVQRVVMALTGLGKPLVAAVCGAASGGGLGWLLLADMAVVAEDANLVPGFLRVGLSPGAAVSLTLSKQMGRIRAGEILLLNRPITPTRALELGLAQRVVPADEVLATAQAMAADLAQGSTGAMAATKTLLRRAALNELAGHLEHERLAVLATADDPEFERRIMAFFAR